ncbi:hypothetical protein [Gordonia westfalica]|nr:hypothetical protein [Gordonia westfalica]
MTSTRNTTNPFASNRDGTPTIKPTRATTAKRLTGIRALSWTAVGFH